MHMGYQSMSRFKGWCNKCSSYTWQISYYQHYEDGLLVTLECQQCGNQVEEFKRYDE